MSNEDRKAWDRFYGEGYYELLVKTGIALGVPEKELAKQLRVPACEVQEMLLAYKEDIRELKVAAKVCARIFDSLQHVRLGRIQMKLLESIEKAVEVGDMSPAQSVKLFQYLTETLSAQKTRIDTGERLEDDLTPAEIEERARRLLEQAGGKR